jgi:NADPH:quinone reductase-like Zn-dependent oxidoreductase
VIATTSREEKAAHLKAIGADDVINYRSTPAWHLAVRELTHGRGADQVVDIGGGTLEQSLQSIALDGQINFIGRLSDSKGTIDINLLFTAVATLRVVFAGNREQFLAMNRAISANRLKPVIDRAFSFENVIEAFRYNITKAARIPARLWLFTSSVRLTRRGGGSTFLLPTVSESVPDQSPE